MPDILARACTTFGCPHTQPCPQHARPTTDRRSRITQRAYDQQRGSASARGYGAKWRKARLAYLAHHPLCRPCQAAGRVTVATIVDHIIPHKGDKRLFWDSSNWQPICQPCHDRKTWQEARTPATCSPQAPQATPAVGGGGSIYGE